MWCSRAKPHLLTCEDWLCEASGEPRYELLREVAAQIGRLDITCDMNPDLAPSSLPDMKMPSLKLLNIFNADSAPVAFRIQSENVPMLRVLELARSKPKILTPLTGVTHLHYSNLHLSEAGAQILSKLPNLQHLALTLGGFPARSRMPPIALPLLTSLELKLASWVITTNVNSFLFLLDFFELPNL